MKTLTALSFLAISSVASGQQPAAPAVAPAITKTSPDPAPTPLTPDEMLALQEGRSSVLTLQSQANSLFIAWLQTPQGRSWTELSEKMHTAERELDARVKSVTSAHKADGYVPSSDTNGKMTWRKPEGVPVASR